MTNNVNDLNVSIIICTKDRPKDLIKCIDSLSSQTYPLYEIIIIDSGNTVFDIKYDNKLRQNTVKHMRHVCSLTQARNFGIDQSNGDIIIFLDDDVILDKDYVYNIARIFDNNKDVGSVCGNIISDLVRSDKLSKLIEYSLVKKIRNFVFNILFLTSWGDGKFHPSGFPTFPIGKKEMMQIECMQGANMAFRREVLKKYRFDENLKGYSYMEDCDISYRVSREYKIIYSPDAKLIHNVSPTSRYSDYSKMKMAIQNHWYMFNKNFPKRIYNRFAFWTSIFGLFFICIISMRIEGVKGLYEGLLIINKNFKKEIKNVNRG